MIAARFNPLDMESLVKAAVPLRVEVEDAVVLDDSRQKGGDA